MKKIFAIVLTTILALVTLVGCSGGGNSITVAVPNDATNEARALLLLQEKGYITLKEGAGITLPYVILLKIRRIFNLEK